MKNNLSIILISFVLGVLFSVSIYQAVTIYKFRKMVNEDHATLIQVVNFLNTQIQASQKGEQQGNPNVLLQKADN